MTFDAEDDLDAIVEHVDMHINISTENEGKAKKWDFTKLLFLGWLFSSLPIHHLCSLIYRDTLAHQFMIEPELFYPKVGCHDLVPQILKSSKVTKL